MFLQNPNIMYISGLYIVHQWAGEYTRKTKPRPEMLAPDLEQVN